MLTREQILEIDAYCAEHKVPYYERLDELGIARHRFYRWKKKYREEDQSGNTPNDGAFMQLTPGGVFMPPMMPPTRTPGKAKAKAGTIESESFLTVEIRTASGTMLRIQGSMTAAHLHEIITAG